MMGKHNLERLSPQERISYQWYSSGNGRLPACLEFGVVVHSPWSDIDL